MKSYREMGLITYRLVCCPRVYPGECKGEKTTVGGNKSRASCVVGQEILGGQNMQEDTRVRVLVNGSWRIRM